jgi:hypothetical protein
MRTPQKSQTPQEPWVELNRQNRAKDAGMNLALKCLCGIVAIVLGSRSVGAETGSSRVAELIGSGRVSVLVYPPQTKFAARLPKQQAAAAVLSPLFGGAVAAARTGEAMREEHQIVDPVLYFRDAFLRKMGEKRKIDAVLVSESGSEDPSELRQRFSTEFALDFKTVVWTLAVFGNHHRIEYWGRARLIRLDSGKVVWKDTCKFRTGNQKEDQPTLEELLRDDAALLKKEFLAATDQCAAELGSR